MLLYFCFFFKIHRELCRKYLLEKFNEMRGEIIINEMMKFLCLFFKIIGAGINMFCSDLFVAWNCSSG